MRNLLHRLFATTMLVFCVAAAQKVTIKGGRDRSIPPQELEALKGLLGRWQCHGKEPATQDSPEHAIEAELELSPDLDGFWRVGRYTQRKTPDNPDPHRELFSIAFDRSGQKFIRVVMDNQGGFTTMQSAGWQNDRWLWVGEGQLGAQKIPLRITLTRRGEREIGSTLEVGIPRGQWSKVLEERCERQRAL